MQRFRIGREQELRPFKKIRSAAEEQLDVIIAIAHEVRQRHVNKVLFHRAPTHIAAAQRVHNQPVAHMIVFHRGGVLVLKRLVPQTDAVEHDNIAAAAQAELHIVEADEQRQRQIAFRYFRHRNAAVPPCVVVGRLLSLVFKDVFEAAHIHIRMDALRIPAVPHAAVFMLKAPHVQAHHRPGHGLARVFRLQKHQKARRALQRLGRNEHVVVHHQCVRKRPSALEDFHHAARKAARAARVLVGKYVNAFAFQRGRIQCAGIV